MINDAYLGRHVLALKQGSQWQRWIQEPSVVRDRDGIPLAVYSFCVCSGSALLGDLLGISRSRERDLLSVLSIYPRLCVLSRFILLYVDECWLFWFSCQYLPPSVWPHVFCGAGHEKRRGEQLKWSLAFAPCGLWGCKNWPTPFPGRMSYKVTKPGLALSVVYLSMFYCIVVY